MSGIYIHIPFCRKACHYCDFHFSTNLHKKNEIIDAIHTEIIQRKEYIDGEIATIYFGGGTPSVLSYAQLEKILNTIYKYLKVSANVEITLESNPEDLSLQKLSFFKETGINRLSIGIQSFENKVLKWMNRAHTGSDALLTYQQARNVGFENISLDIIYAIPLKEHVLWKKDLDLAVSLSPDHLSIYGLTIEDKTVFGKWVSQNKLSPLTENRAAEQYVYISSFLKDNGYEQYEISNFCRLGFESKHNGSYWNGNHYLGVGPGAHSYNGVSRQINIANNMKYLQSINHSSCFYQTEYLNKIQLMNEFLLTRLRTAKGLNLNEFKKKFHVDLYNTHKIFINKLIQKKMAIMEENIIKLTTLGFLVADEIVLQLSLDEKKIFL